MFLFFSLVFKRWFNGVQWCFNDDFMVVKGYLGVIFMVLHDVIMVFNHVSMVLMEWFLMVIEWF